MTEVILFTQEMCGACAVQKEQNEGIESEFPEVEFREIDIQNEMEIAQAFGVRKTPTTHIYTNGEQVNEFIGIISREDLEDAI